MPTYRVYGSKTAEFYITVEAADPDEAYDIANSNYTQWFELNTDESIEPYQVVLVNSAESGELEYNQDIEYPSMEPGILIEGNK